MLGGSVGVESPSPPVLGRWTRLIDDSLRRSALRADSFLGRMTSYHMGWVDEEGRPAEVPAGKRIRPSLCLWAAAACGAEPEMALPVACAIELVHNFTLVHDDIQDGDLLRRGRPAVWAVWGLGQGINAGDALFAQAALELASQPQAGRVLAEAVLEVIEGQCLDLEHEGRLGTHSVDDYLRLVEAKTGALLGACLEAGATVAGATAQVRGRARRAGRLLGVAFQLRDDWLGVWGDPELTGKSRDSDIAKRKLSHPVVAAHRAADPERRRRLEHFYDGKQEGGESEIRALLEELGGPELTRAEAAATAAEAVDQIEACGFSRERVQEFADVAHHIAQRRG
jgi:geranylgeranyl diphosphate synthase type I